MTASIPTQSRAPDGMDSTDSLVREVVASWAGGERFTIAARGRWVVADETRGPGPVEMFVGSIAACIAACVGAELRSQGAGEAGLVVQAAFRTTDTEAVRIERIHLRVDPPESMPRELVPVLRDAVRRCPALNSLREPPLVDVEIDAR